MIKKGDKLKYTLLFLTILSIPILGFQSVENFEGLAIGSSLAITHSLETPTRSCSIFIVDDHTMLKKLGPYQQIAATFSCRLELLWDPKYMRAFKIPIEKNNWLNQTLYFWGLDLRWKYPDYKVVNFFSTYLFIAQF